MTAPPGPLPVLYQDDTLVVVNKPSGLAAHRGWAREEAGYVLTRVRDQVGQHVYLGHRLDRGTSGACVLLLHPGDVQPLQQSFQQGAVEKRYLALARGIPPEHVFVDYAVPKSYRRGAERIEAQTEFWRHGVCEERYSLMEARPLTGRLHQIRRHLRHLRHPIIGDTSYGDGQENKKLRARFGLYRLALHAWKLSFPHPRTGERIAVEAPPTQDLQEVWGTMGLWPL